MNKESKPDNIVYNYEIEKYDASLKNYPTNIGAPSITTTDINHWKNIAINKVNHFIESEFQEIKDKYNYLIELCKWNEIVYSSEFKFEPIIGKIYHLYKSKKNTLFLSEIKPSEWNKVHIGTFKLNSDRLFEKLNMCE